MSESNGLFKWSGLETKEKLHLLYNSVAAFILFNSDLALNILIVLATISKKDDDSSVKRELMEMTNGI